MTVGLPVLRRLFHVQNSRNRRRCHAMTVSGLTITSTVRHSLQAREPCPEQPVESCQPKPTPMRSIEDIELMP